MPVGFPTKVNYNTGDVLSAQNMNDLSGTVNLLESAAESAAGVNKFLNSDFGIWQRGTSINAPDGAATFLADRFLVNKNGTGGTTTVTQQTFTPGSAPVAGYEGTYFLRYASTVASTGQSFQDLMQKIEDVRQFAGQTVTVSFWAKFATAAQVLPILQQNFGSGGSSIVATVGSNISVGTTWTRYSQTFAIPSITGKTIGTSSFLEFDIRLPQNTIQTFDTWGWQIEGSSVASDFKTATGTKQGELAACQRYFYDPYFNSTGANQAVATANSFSTTRTYFGFTFPVSLRGNPAVTLTAANFTVGYSSGANAACSAYSLLVASNQYALIDFTHAATTSNVSFSLFRPGTTAGIQFSSEL